MKENIETKDVQRTEYLDKNGLDMLWAKVKENTRNQVEVERNRAVAKENSIIDTKADKSEFSNYVPSATFTALEKKVSANTAAISNKQNAGNYLHYETLNDEGYYEIPSVCISDIDYNLHHTILNPESIQIVTGDLEGNDTTGIAIESNGRNPYIALTDSAYTNTLKITRDGISNADNNANHVYATDGSIADLTQYAKKSEITAGGNVDDVQVNGVTVVENKIANIKPATKESLGVVKVGDGLNVTDGTISVDTTAIGSGKYIPYARYEHDEYVMLNNIKVEGDGSRDALNSHIGRDGLSVYKMQDSRIYSNIQCAKIELQSGENRIRINDNVIDVRKLDNSAIDGTSYCVFGLSKYGVQLKDGDDNHVLTSNASTIDITQYVLKSVYDEKIAALEARIAALEAKHAEAAA